jgi:glycosyltransferase involved in cell wall biosynthesis
LFLAVASELVRRGWRVELLAAGPEPALRAAVRAPLQLVDIGPAALRALPLPRLVRLSLGVGTLARWIDARCPALLFGTSIPPNLASLVAARRARWRVPVVVRQSNTIRIAGHPRYGGLRRRWRDPSIPRLYRRAAAVIAVAEEVADNLEAIGAAPRERVDVIHNAVAVEDASRLAREQPEHSWFEAHDDPVVLSVGRLVRKKDQVMLLEAFARLRRRRPARLVIFGEGPMRNVLESRIAELGIADDVALPGHTENPFAHIARADLFVLSSISEGMPSVLIEALACGTPIVSTDCPSGPREILADGRFGELVPVGDAEALTAAMARQLDAPADPERLIARAAEFAPDRIVPRYVEVLERAAAGGAATGAAAG